MYLNIAYGFPAPKGDAQIAETTALHEALTAALDWHFPSWEDAAKAWDAYRKIEDEIEARGAELLPPGEALTVELENNPAAAAWASFLATAEDVGENVYARSSLGLDAEGRRQPFGFQFKFVVGADAPPSEFPAPVGKTALGPGRGA